MIEIKSIIQNILIVEDSPVDASIVNQALTHCFPEYISATAVITIAATIEEATQILSESGPFDIITLDGNIGQRTSLELLPLLEEKGYLGKIIMLPGDVRDWTSTCIEKDIPIFQKLSLKSIAATDLFQLAA